MSIKLVMIYVLLRTLQTCTAHAYPPPRIWNTSSSSTSWEQCHVGPRGSRGRRKYTPTSRHRRQTVRQALFLLPHCQGREGLSSDVSLTCSILNELGKTLELDDQARPCSKQAFSTAQDVLKECEAVFQQIDTAIEKYDQDTDTNRLRRGAPENHRCVPGAGLGCPQEWRG